MKLAAPVNEGWLYNNDRYAIIRNQEKISTLIEKDIIPNWLQR